MFFGRRHSTDSVFFLLIRFWSRRVQFGLRKAINRIVRGKILPAFFVWIRMVVWIFWPSFFGGFQKTRVRFRFPKTRRLEPGRGFRGIRGRLFRSCFLTRRLRGSVRRRGTNRTKTRFRVLCLRWHPEQGRRRR